MSVTGGGPCERARSRRQHSNKQNCACQVWVSGEGYGWSQFGKASHVILDDQTTAAKIRRNYHHGGDAARRQNPAAQDLQAADAARINRVSRVVSWKRGNVRLTPRNPPQDPESTRRGGVGLLTPGAPTLFQKGGVMHEIEHRAVELRADSEGVLSGGVSFPTASRPS